MRFSCTKYPTRLVHILYFSFYLRFDNFQSDETNLLSFFFCPFGPCVEICAGLVFFSALALFGSYRARKVFPRDPPTSTVLSILIIRKDRIAWDIIISYFVFQIDHCTPIYKCPKGTSSIIKQFHQSLSLPSNMPYLDPKP